MKRFLCIVMLMAFGLASFSQNSPSKLNHPRANESVRINYTEPIDPRVAETAFTAPENMVQTQTQRGLNFDETHISTTQFDMQTNASLGNRVFAWEDGTVAAISTWGVSGAPSFPDRGTAYSFYDGSNWSAMPTARQEPFRSGWPSIAPFGENGEVLASHGGTPFGINVYTRPEKGSGEWTLSQLPNVGGYELAWPRVATSGPDLTTIHVVATDQGADDIPMFYNRSTDGGESWDGWIEMPGLDSEFYNWNHTADNYVFAQNGDVLALAFFSRWFDVFYLKSTDGGETWEHHVAWEHPYPGWDWDVTQTSDTLYTNDNTGNITIDNNGNVHLVWGITRIAYWEAGTGSYNYWPYTQGIAYWNETMGQIPDHPENVHHTLNPDYLFELGMLVGWVPDEDGDGEVSIFDFELFTYPRAMSMTSWPTIAIDGNGSIVVAFSTVSETRNNGEYYYRSIYASYKDGLFGTWYHNADNLMDSFIHLFDEGIYPTAAARANWDAYPDFWIVYNADNTPGIAAFDEDHAFNENQMYAVRIAPFWVGLNTQTSPITNISAAYPNPSSGQAVNFDLNLSKANANVVVSVYNLAGQLVSKNVENTSLGMNRIMVETSNLRTGVYFCTIEVDGYKETRKFVVR